MKIALLGYGTVGTGVKDIVKTMNGKIEIVSILVKNKDKYKDDEYFSIITNNFEKVLNSKPDIIVEVMGGIEPALTYTKKAMKENIHVVTANKQLVSQNGPEIIKLAKEKDLAYKFEASVGGAIPIVKSLTDAAKFDRISKIRGILNGTSNYILTKVLEDEIDYSEAIKSAQQLGFAEMDPSSDVDGHDAARKLAILSTIAYGRYVNVNDIDTRSIRDITLEQIKKLSDKGFKIKQLAESYIENDKVFAYVGPAIIDKNDKIHSIDGELNYAEFDALNSSVIGISGKGAGKLPTGSAVIKDILDIINNDINLAEQFLNEEISVHNIDPETKYVKL